MDFLKIYFRGLNSSCGFLKNFFEGLPGFVKGFVIQGILMQGLLGQLSWISHKCISKHRTIIVHLKILIQGLPG